MPTTLMILKALSPVLFTTIALAGATATAKSTPAPAPTAGPRGGAILQDDTARFEVKVGKDGRVVDVYSLDQRKKLPPKMSITLFRDTELNETIELRAVNPMENFAHYQGALSPNAGSVAGIELRFELSPDAFKVLRSLNSLPPGAFDSRPMGGFNR